MLTLTRNVYPTYTYNSQYTTVIILHPNIINVALPVSLNQNCQAASDYLRRKRLYSGEYGRIPQLSRIPRQDYTNVYTCFLSGSNHFEEERKGSLFLFNE